jgi:hypothetical protein
MAQWLLENGDRASVVSFLVIALSLIILGLAKQWWVPGWLYHQ